MQSLDSKLCGPIMIPFHSRPPPWSLDEAKAAIIAACPIFETAAGSLLAIAWPSVFLFEPILDLKVSSLGK